KIGVEGLSPRRGRVNRKTVGGGMSAECPMSENEDTMKCGKTFAGWHPLVMLLLLAAALSGCGKKAEEPVAEAGKTFYTCPMHPQVIRDAPGTCPICNMDLVPVEDDGDHARHDEADHEGAEHPATEPAAPENPGSGTGRPVVRIDPAVARNIGIRTAPVTRRALPASLRVDGIVAPEEGRVRSVTARVDGYAEAVRADATGLAVGKDEVLLEAFAPEVAVAQERLLQAGDAAASRRRLLNLGVPSSFIARLERTGRIERRFPVVAPVG